ncbi:hypothetical protein BJX62DRAFT_154200 [Aspergillus germanicus]
MGLSGLIRTGQTRLPSEHAASWQRPLMFFLCFCTFNARHHLKRHALLEPIKYRASQQTTAIPTGQQSQQAACRDCGRTRIFFYPSFHKEFTPDQLILLGIGLWPQVTTPVDQGRFERWTFTTGHLRDTTRDASRGSLFHGPQAAPRVKLLSSSDLHSLPSRAP